MKIAFYPHVPHYTIGLSRALRELDVDVHLISEHNPSVAPPEPSLHLLGRATTLPSAVRNAMKRAKQLSRFDVVHTQSALNSFSALMAKSQYGIPFVMTAHGFAQPEIEPIGINLLFQAAEFGLFRRVAEEAASVATLTRYSRDEILRRHRIACRVIYHGVDRDLFNPNIDGAFVRKRLGIGEEERLVLWAARMTPLKDPLTFAKSAKIIQRVFPNTKFLMIGDGPLRNSVRREVSEMIASGTFITRGRVEFQQMANHYAACDIFVTTSWREGFGLSVAEAMACAKPVIACKAGSIPEVVGDAGLYFPPTNAVELASKIEHCIQNPKQAFELAHRATERITTNFTWENAAKEYLQSYERAK